MKNKKRYYYAIVRKNTGKLFILGSQLPIFWYMRVAKKVCSKLTNCEVIKIDVEALEKLVSGSNIHLQIP